MATSIQLRGASQRIRANRCRQARPRRAAPLLLYAALSCSVAHADDVARQPAAPGLDGSELSLKAALLTALRLHPSLALAQNAVQAREADVLASQAAFDPFVETTLGHNRDAHYLSSAERTYPQARSTSTHTSLLGVSAGLATHWGTRIEPALTLQRVQQTLGTVAGESSLPAAQQAVVGLKISQSLLRGRGVIGTASELYAARHARAAAVESAVHAAQLQVLDTMVAYFKLVQADRNLSSFRESAARTERLFQETEVLVEAEHRTRADLRQVDASLANQRSLLLTAQSDLSLARIELALAMGLDGREALEWLPSDGFPRAHSGEPEAQGIVDRSLDVRHDLRAARASTRAASTLLAGAERNTSPLLDLELSIGYVGGRNQDGIGSFLTSPAYNIPGVNGGATLKLQLPVQNAAARARVERTRADERSALVQQRDVARRVSAGVRGALADMRMSALAVTEAARAVELLERLVVDERDKLREGLSTIIDVVFTEERLTQARLTHVARQYRYAVAWAQLQYESGALPSQETALLAASYDLLPSERADEP